MSNIDRSNSESWNNMSIRSINNDASIQKSSPGQSDTIPKTAGETTSPKTVADNISRIGSNYPAAFQNAIKSFPDDSKYPNDIPENPQFKDSRKDSKLMHLALSLTQTDIFQK